MNIYNAIFQWQYFMFQAFLSLSGIYEFTRVVEEYENE